MYDYTDGNVTIKAMQFTETYLSARYAFNFINNVEPENFCAPRCVIDHILNNESITLPNKQRVILGDYIVRTSSGEFYCEPKLEFEKLYRKMEYVKMNNTVTKEKLDKLIEASAIEYAYFDNTMTIAVVKLPCGFKITGQSSCVDPNNFNKELGEKYALENAYTSLWELEGYLLANKLHEAKLRS